MANLVSAHPYVIVHVWKPESVDKTQKRSKKAVGPSFGHVALETRTGTLEDRCVHYISFWPPGKCHATDQSHFHSFVDDRNYETRPPDISYELTTLDVDKINETFEKFLQKPFQWRALGSGIFRKKYASNCSGLVMHLLEKGGIRELVPSDQEFKKRVVLLSLLSLVALFYFKNPFNTGIFRQLNEVKKKLYNPVSLMEPYWAYRLNNIKQGRQINNKCKTSSECQTIKPFIKEILIEDNKSTEVFSLLMKEKTNSSTLSQIFRSSDLLLKTSILPPLFSSAILFIHYQFFWETVKPSDVEKIVQKAKKKKEGKEPPLFHNKLTFEHLGAASVFCGASLWIIHNLFIRGKSNG